MGQQQPSQSRESRLKLYLFDLQTEIFVNKFYVNLGTEVAIRAREEILVEKNILRVQRATMIFRELSLHDGTQISRQRVDEIFVDPSDGEEEWDRMDREIKQRQTRHEALPK